VADVDDQLETLARGDGVLGEVALRRRIGADEQPIFELIVNGMFLMDTAETATETMLSDVVLDRHPAPRRVLVGGLGLGLTVMALLVDARVEQVVVCEIEPQLVKWLRSGLVPMAQPMLADPRVDINVADVIDVLRDAESESYDAVLLDVDNGPAFLVHPDNAALYERPALAEVARVLVPGGLFAVWSADPSADLLAALTYVIGPSEEIVRTVVRDGRDVEYYLYVAQRVAAGPLAPAPPELDDVRHD
jgi:spermidine synthase